jgi:hypothetical protein
MADLKDTPGLRAEIERSLANEIHNLKNNLRRAQNSWDEVNRTNGSKVAFEVLLQSLWSDYGEQNIRSNSTLSLKQAIRQAQKRFKKINNRGDVQARYSVYVHIVPKVSDQSKNQCVKVPEKFYAHLI